MNVRLLTEDDHVAVAEFLRRDEERLYGRPSLIEATDVHQWLSETDATGSWLYEDAAGVAAVAWMWYRDETLAEAIGVVGTRVQGRGIGTEMVERSEQLARGRGATRIHQLALGPDATAASLLRAHGYRDVRHFYDMAIELVEPPAAPAVPIERFREEDGRAFHAALDEAFQDHWGHAGRTFEQWWERHVRSPSFDPTLWFLIRDGDEIAAVVRNEANRNGGGYVGALGARRPWRGRGYAKALLLRTFHEFFERGMRRVTLGVDAESPTGATHLYERAGMHVEAENVVFEKAL